jgi:hypothetical protein
LLRRSPARLIALVTKIKVIVVIVVIVVVIGSASFIAAEVVGPAPLPLTIEL